MTSLVSGLSLCHSRKDSPSSTLYHPTVYVRERSPTLSSPHRLLMYCWRSTASLFCTFPIVWNIATMDNQGYALNTATAYKVDGVYLVNCTLGRQTSPLSSATPLPAGASRLALASKWTLLMCSPSTNRPPPSRQIPSWRHGAAHRWTSGRTRWTLPCGAVWCATASCGVSAVDHLRVTKPLMRSIYLFHIYYQVQRILAGIQAPLRQDQTWSATANPYDQRAYERICNKFGISTNTNWHVPGPNHGSGRVYFWAGRYVPAYRAVDSDNYNPEKISFTKKDWPWYRPCGLCQARPVGSCQGLEALHSRQVTRFHLGRCWVAQWQHPDLVYVWALLGAQHRYGWG